MSLVIRLSLMGKKGEAKYRVVVKEKRSKRDGAAIDTIGFYQKGLKASSHTLDNEKLAYWKSKGAQISPAVEKMLETK